MANLSDCLICLTGHEMNHVANHAFFFFSCRRRHTRLASDWSSDVCSSDLPAFDHLNQCCGDLLRFGPVDEIEIRVALLSMKLWEVAFVDPVSRGDDPAMSRLAEHLRQPHHGHDDAFDDVPQHHPRANGGQLVYVPY